MRIRRPAAAVLVCAVIGGLAACSASGSGGSGGPFDGMSGPEVHAKAYAATKAADSLRLTGRVRTDGKDIRMDLALNVKGECAGTVALGSAGTAEIIRSSGFVYYKGDAALYRSQAAGRSKQQADAMVAMLAGRWLKMRTDSPQARESGRMCDLDALLKSFGKSSPVAAKGGPATVGGQPALTVTVTSAGRGKAKGREKPKEDGVETYYVATRGEPYLLRATKGGEEPGDITFSGYGEPVDLTPPAGKDVIDAATLRKVD